MDIKKTILDWLEDYENVSILTEEKGKITKKEFNKLLKDRFIITSKYSIK